MAVTVETLNPFHVVQRQVEAAVRSLNLEPAAYEILKQPQRVLEVNFPVTMDDGSVRVFTGYRSQHCDAPGPTKGGLRFHPELYLDEVRALSMWMTFKCSVLNLPYGGGKGGVICNPKELSEGELERLSRGYMRAIAQIVGPEKDIPAPDVYTTPQIMAWMADEFSRLKQSNSWGVLTGKPLDMGGSEGRGEATARGCVTVLRAAAQRLGIPFAGSRAAVQGYGNAGSIAARMLHEQGVKVLAVSDSKGGIFNAAGLDPAAVLHHKDRTGSVLGFAGSRTITNRELLALDVDFLVPAAFENQITAEVAPNVKAKIISEAANGPTTPEADAILNARGIVAIPDILASAGGVTVSYFEWVQNLAGFYWTEGEVNQRLDAMMEKSFAACWAMKEQRHVTLRDATFMVAVDRVVRSMRARGWLH